MDGAHRRIEAEDGVQDVPAVPAALQRGGVGGVGEHGEDPTITFEDRGRTGQARLGQQRRLGARAGRHSGVQALDLTARAVVFHGPARVTGRDAESVGQLLRVQVQHLSCRGGGAEYTHDLGTVPPGAEHALAGHRPQQTHHLHPGDDRDQQVPARRAIALSQGKRGGNHSRGSVPGQLVGVVELTRRAERSVHPRRLGGRGAPLRTGDGGLIRSGRQLGQAPHRLHIGQGRTAYLQPQLVEYQHLRPINYILGQVLEPQVGDPTGQPLRDRRGSRPGRCEWS